MKKADPAHEVVVLERNGPDDTFGWGVVFSNQTLENLRRQLQPWPMERRDITPMSSGLSACVFIKSYTIVDHGARTLEIWTFAPEYEGNTAQIGYQLVQQLTE